MVATAALPSVAIGFGGANEININGNATQIADGDVTPSLTDDSDYGSVVVGTPLAHTFTIQNTGTADLVIGLGAITISGADASMFVVSGITLPATILPGGSTTFDITFTPTSNGLKTATVTILNDDCSESIYDFAIQGNGTAPLPVNLLSWRGEQAAQSVMLYWTTAQEQEIDHFEVERSLDGSRFEFKGMRAAAGTSATEQSYSLPDDHPNAVNYYRLKTIGKNGDTQLSEVIRFDFHSTEGFNASVFPNPTSEHIVIATDRIMDEVSIYSADGKMVLQLFKVAPYTEIGLTTVANGVYSVRIQVGEKALNRKLVLLKK